MSEDWKIKFKDYLTASGNMKRSLTTEEKTEIFTYRVKDKFEVVGKFGATQDVPVPCKCKVCGYVSSLVPKELVRGNTACKVCSGKEKIKIDGIPEHLMYAMPAHVAIRGVTEPYRGVQWLNMDTLDRNIFYIIEYKHRGLYSFATLNTKMFKDLEQAALFVNGVCASDYAEAYETIYWEMPNYEDTPSGIWRGWEHATFHNMWVTEMAPLILYCLDKKYRKHRYYREYLDDLYTYQLTQEQLDEFRSLKDINSILEWSIT